MPLYIGGAEQAETSNIDGDFEYIFEEAGDYQITIALTVFLRGGTPVPAWLG